MTLEERVQLHDQWLLSIESNQTQFAANLAALERKMEALQAFQEQTSQQIGQITGILVQVVQNQALFSASLTTLVEEHRRLVEEHRKLTETVNSYIRYRGDGREQN